MLWALKNDKVLNFQQDKIENKMVLFIVLARCTLFGLWCIRLKSQRVFCCKSFLIRTYLEKYNKSPCRTLTSLLNSITTALLHVVTQVWPLFVEAGVNILHYRPIIIGAKFLILKLLGKSFRKIEQKGTKIGHFFYQFSTL